MTSLPTRAVIGAFAAIACACTAAASPSESGSAVGSSASAKATAIAAGGAHTCLLTGTGAVKCWGYNAFGQLGDGTRTERHTPVGVLGLASGMVAITAGGGHTCALTRGGAVECWGYNGSGQLGDGTTTDRRTPVKVSGLAGGVTAIAAGGSHTCALASAGGVKCWGENGYGALGDGTTTDRRTPVTVSRLAGGVTAIAAGDFHSCALTSAGAARCWGANARGELGDGTTHGRHAPVAVSGLAGGVSAIAADRNHSCALTRGGAVKCWGLNSYGELGDGTTTRRLTPVAVSGLGSKVTAISVGETHSCALTSAGAVKCWGWNGTPTIHRTPAAVSGLGSGVKAITARGTFYDGSLRGYSCALTNTGRAKCWGWNLNGQLGDGTTTDRHKPVGVIGFGGAFNCVVPNVLGKPLAKAKPWIRRAHCRVGSVTRVASSKRKGTIVGQNPRPWKRLKKGAKINLAVSRGR